MSSSSTKAQANLDEATLKKSIHLWKTLKGQISEAGKSLSQLLSAGSAMKGIVQQTKEAVSELKKADTILSEIGRLDGRLSKSDLQDIRDNAFDIAGRYGKKAADYLEAVREASLAGYKDAAGIAELSLALQKAGGITAELASQYIFAADQAYQLGGSAGKLKEIFDGSSRITDHNAVTMADLAEGMSLVSTQAASLGVGANEAAAALGTMMAMTQQGGFEMSEAFQVILLNLQQITDLERGVDAEGLAKFEKACKALNVPLQETKNGVAALRSPMDAIRDLAREYAKLGSNDARRTDLLRSIGGGMPADALHALLENYSMYSQMLGQYKDSTGSLASEAAKMADTWEDALNRLHNTWAATIGNIADSDAVTSIINSFNDLLSYGDKLTSFLGPAASIGAGAGLFTGLKNVGMAK